MLLFESIKPLYFMVAFGIGMFLSYVFAPEPKIIIQYPTKDNAGKITYQDDAGVCYKYRAVHTECPADKSKIKKIPIQ